MSMQYSDAIGICHIGIGSVNAAMRAARLLQREGVSASLIKNEGGKREGGCLYGLALPCLQMEGAKRILADHNISVRKD